MASDRHQANGGSSLAIRANAGRTNPLIDVGPRYGRSPDEQIQACLPITHQDHRRMGLVPDLVRRLAARSGFQAHPTSRHHVRRPDHHLRQLDVDKIQPARVHQNAAPDWRPEQLRQSERPNS
jgi:hypothetical protein